jgi:uncharacterized delta-60 repeat protein
MRTLCAATLLVLLGCGGGGGGGGGSPPPGGGGPTPGPPGTLDTNFGAATGKVLTPIGSADDKAYAVALQADGKIVVGGSTHNGSNLDFAVARYNADGTLDTTFDSDGKTATAVGSSDDAINALAIQGDGRIVAAGYAVVGGDYDFALVRYNTDGSLDATFDTDGRVVTSAQNLYNARAIALQSDGKIVVGGYADTGGRFVVARYLTDGSLDTTFDTDGIVKMGTAPGDPPDLCFSIAIQADQKILAAGQNSSFSGPDFCVARFNSNGSLDTTFDTDGIADVEMDGGATDTNTVSCIGVTGGGNIVLGGAVIVPPGAYDFAAARITSAGALETTLDGDGRAYAAIGASYDEAFALAVQSDNKIVLAGYSFNNVNEDFALVRFNANGSLDTTFDVDGILTLIFGTGDERAHGVALQSDGRIVVAGFAWNGTDYDFAVARIWP